MDRTGGDNQDRDGAPRPPPPRTDFKALYRELEEALGTISRTENTSEMLETILETLLERFRDKLGFSGGRIYRREGDDYELCCGFGSSRDAPIGLRVPRDYPPHRKTLEEGLLIMRLGEVGFDEAFERAIGVSSTFAAITVGEGATHVIAFSIDGDVREEQVLYSLTAVRHVINLKLEQQRVTGMIEESRLIQESLLPHQRPEFQGYDIDGRSRSAERVGGDVYDYLPLSSQLLGIAIADSTGKGIPAALLARDVITGLRVAVGEDVKVARTIRRLNHVIHRAALSRKFVSLFYAELALDGTLVYCNAGHDPPLLLGSGGFRRLDTGGPVLGPIPGAHYQVGQEQLVPGDVLAMFTDGLVECEDPSGEPFGPDRLREVLTRTAGSEARGILNAIFDAVASHAGPRSPRDDVTAVVVKKR